MASSIRLLTPPKFSSCHVGPVAAALAQQFHADVQLHEYTFNLQHALDRARGQYLSAALLRQMCADFSPSDGSKLVGITDVDLFAPVLTFVFGEAQLGGTCAILSTFRLRNKFYGIPESAAVLEERVVKEAVHEVGHLFGLIHCRTFDCVMRSSTYVEEIDLKSVNVCKECRISFGAAEDLNTGSFSGMRTGKKRHS